MAMRFLRHPAGAAALAVAALAAAVEATAQTRFDARLLPSPPGFTVPDAEAAARTARPAARSPIELVPGLIVDELPAPDCIFIANHAEGDGLIVQTAEIGVLTLICD